MMNAILANSPFAKLLNKRPLIMMITFMSINSKELDQMHTCLLLQFRLKEISATLMFSRVN